jgi:hypothetical protein
VVLLLLVVLVEGVAAGAHGRRRRGLLRDLVPVRVLRVLLRLVLLVLYGGGKKNPWNEDE